jgi:prepilin-type N-terminal cleavage/methylation domain-containing protein
MKKAFTLIELLVVVVILVVIGSIIIGAFSGVSSEDDEGYEWYVSPEIQNMRSQRKMADELERQNDLRERELELLKKPERE